MALELLIDGVDQVCLLIYSSLTVEQRADAFVSTCSFQLLDEAASLSFEEKQIVLIQDGAEIYFAGTIANVQSENLAEGTESLVHTIQCQDYNIQVEEVVIDQLEEFAATADNVIIDNIFDDYLPEINTHDPVGGGYVQHLHVFAEIDFYAISLREALDRIATEVESTALAGYWYINYEAGTKYLHYFAVEDNAPAWSLSDTPNYVDSFPYLSAVRKDRQGAAIVNRILVCGADVDLFVQNQDSHDYYGKWFEAIVRDNTLLGVDEVIDHGNALLAKWAYPDEAYEVITRKSGLRAGMNVEFDCTLFGTADRLNLVENPSFEINVADFWTFWQAGAMGGVSQDNTHVSVGANAARLLASNAGNAELRSDNIAVAAGETITVQARLYRAVRVDADIEIYDVTNAASRATAAPTLDRIGTWEFLTVSWTNPGAAVNISFRLRNTEADAASVVWFDGCMAELNKGPKPVQYIDGTLPYCSWDGVAHDSVSRRPPVYMVKQLTITWPENTPTYSLSLGGNVTQTALIKARTSGDDILSGLGPVVDGQVPLASRGWSHDLRFSALDDDTVQWVPGDIVTAAGQTFSIAPAGNTGNMAAATVHYIYLDVDVSQTALQVSAGVPVVGGNIILIAVCAPALDATEATYQVFGGSATEIGVFITADHIAANSITANEIAANTISAAEIVANTITAAQIFAGTITATEIAADTIRPVNLLIGGFGDQIFNAADGLLLLGPRNEIAPPTVAPWTDGEWWSPRRQMATLSGAFHQEAGYWQGTKGLMVEEGTTNLFLNPSVETDLVGWGVYAVGTAVGTHASSTEQARFGEDSCKCQKTGGAAADEYGTYFGSVFNVGAATDYTITIWVNCTAMSAGGAGGLVRASAYGNWGVAGAFAFVEFTPLTDVTNGWVRMQASFTTVDAATCTARAFFDSTATGTMYVDGVQAEALDSYATSYCDGSLGTGYVWTGAVHASTSTRTATEVQLDDYVGLITDNDTFSVRAVVQAQYDYDAEWPDVWHYVFDASDGTNNERVIVLFDDGANRFHTYVNGAARITCDVVAFSAGDWLDIVATFDFATDTYYVYLNGVLIGSNATALVAPTGMDRWSIGSDVGGAGLQCGGFTFSEYAVFDRVLTADESAMLHEMNRPVVDAGSIDKPGIYILDGLFKIASSTTGSRIEIDADRIAGIDSAGNPQFYLQSSDGIAYAGAGSVYLSSLGITLVAGGAGTTSYIKWDSGGSNVAIAYGADAGGFQELILRGDSDNTGDMGRVLISATGFGALKNASVYVVSGDLADDNPEVRIELDANLMFAVYETYTYVVEDLWVKKGIIANTAGYINPNDGEVWAMDGFSSDGVNIWKFANRVGHGDVACNGHCNISIGGAVYKLMTTA